MAARASGCAALGVASVVGYGVARSALGGAPAGAWDAVTVAEGHQQTSDTNPAGCAACRAEAPVRRCVEALYVRGGVAAAALSPNAVFQDPVARCDGIEEVLEAFRALQAFSPELLAPVAVARVGKRDFEVDLRMRYTFHDAAPPLDVRSLVAVTVAEDGRVEQIEERWNGVPLLTGPPFEQLRRAVGVASFALTPLVIRR